MPTGDRDIGVAFSVVCDLGFAVGLCTHRHARMGSLVWIAEDTWDHQPHASEVAQIKSWRWPVFFPLGSAIRRGLVDRLGRVEVPAELSAYPRMRSGGGAQPWFVLEDGEVVGVGTTTQDRTLPIAQLVNDTRLKEMIVSGWRTEDRW